MFNPNQDLFLNLTKLQQYKLIKGEIFLSMVYFKSLECCIFPIDNFTAESCMCKTDTRGVPTASIILWITIICIYCVLEVQYCPVCFCLMNRQKKAGAHVYIIIKNYHCKSLHAHFVWLSIVQAQSLILNYNGGPKPL